MATITLTTPTNGSPITHLRLRAFVVKAGGGVQVTYTEHDASGSHKATKVVEVEAKLAKPILERASTLEATFAALLAAKLGNVVAGKVAP